MFLLENDMEVEPRFSPPMGKPVSKAASRPKPKLRPMYLGQWLARLDRKAADVAKAVGCTPGYLSALISNKHDKNPSTEFMLTLSEELGVSINALFMPPPPRDVTEGAQKLTDRQWAALLEILALRGTRPPQND